MKDLEKILKVYTKNQATEYDPYFHGIVNGLILAIAILKEEEAVFLSAEETYIKGVEND